MGEALQESKSNALVLDGTIQRFEFVFELCWKSLKRALTFEGIECATPREAIQKSFQAQWITNETLWLDMLQDRNMSSHTYQLETAEEIYRHIQNYFLEIQRLLQFLKARYPIS